jgi:hypothetical protein
MRKILFTLLIIGTITSCSDNDSELTDTLNGKWSLILSECTGCSGNQTYNPSDYTYTFDLNTNKVVITKEQNVPIQHLAGTYDITVNNNELKIEPYSTVFNYSFENNKLYLQDGSTSAESIKLTFTRDQD